VLTLRIAVSLALVVGTLTFIHAFSYGARLSTIMYRVAISVLVFGFVGYGLGEVFLKFFKTLSAKYEPQVTEEQIETETETEESIQSNQSELELASDSESESDSEFSPFTPENFKQMTRPKE